MLVWDQVYWDCDCDDDAEEDGEVPLLSIWRARLARATFGALPERRLRSLR